MGLDLGTASIGWALVDEAESRSENAEIVKLGVRVVQYDTFGAVDGKTNKVPGSKDPVKNFESGRGLSSNAARTHYRGARRNLQRFKKRREDLIALLMENGFIAKDTPLTEVGKNTTHETLRLRAKAARQRIEKPELARVFLAINKKRGYKSNRKAQDGEAGSLIDGMAVARELYENNWTPGQFVYRRLQAGKHHISEFYRSDLQAEFDRVWHVQRQFYPDILTDALYEKLQGKNEKKSWKICEEPFQIKGIKQPGKAAEKRLQQYAWRVSALEEKLDLEYLAIVLQEINHELNKPSGYLGAISNRSKELFFNGQTVGENLYAQIQKNPHTSLKNQVFYRQDYLDEFERIWETQQAFYPEMTADLKAAIRDGIIFYQRRLRSQKGLIRLCEFERWKTQVEKEGKQREIEVGHRVIPKSAPLFQEFKIWQTLNNLVFQNEETREQCEVKGLDAAIRQRIFEELNLGRDLKPEAIARIIGLKGPSKWRSNFEKKGKEKKIQGNRTYAALFGVYRRIAELEGYGFDWQKKSPGEVKAELKAVFQQVGICSDILDFDAEFTEKSFDKQASYQLWHLLYSAEADSGKISEADREVYGKSHVALKKKLHQKYGFKPAYAAMLANVSLLRDYGNLSAKAIKKIMKHLKAGQFYSEACQSAGYNHSHSLTTAERADRICKDKLTLLQRNGLRSPVVEKILNQMVNLVNQIVDAYGKPDEVRIELARDLKKSAKERSDISQDINKATKAHEEIKEILRTEFGIPNSTHNDVIRYRLYKELEANAYKTLYTERYIPREKLFSKEIEVEHIIPKAKSFDDSFSNKTLAYHAENEKKGDRTAWDFIAQDHYPNLESYKARVENLHEAKKISKAKRNKLLMPAEEIPGGFLNRDLAETRYITKKAKQLLEEVVPTVHTTTGKVTDRLRQDWGLTDVIKELNLPKYRELGLTKLMERKDGNRVEQIIDWTKRSDHRHHAMDALTVAFTTHSHVQYLNNLHAGYEAALPALIKELIKKHGKEHARAEAYKLHKRILSMREKITEKDGRKERRFIPPMPNFRREAKKHIEDILISFKARNKVVTPNVNKTKKKEGWNEKMELTPRGQLHEETLYGRVKRLVDKPTKLSKRFTLKQARLIAEKTQRMRVLDHLKKFNDKPVDAFDAKTLKREPMLYRGKPLREVQCFEEIYTIRKEVTPDLKIDKVLDEGIKAVLRNRLSEFGGDPKKAFSDLDKNPIWLDKKEKIALKRVTIEAHVNKATPLREKRDHFGHLISDEEGDWQDVDFVQAGNNHHVAIYRDEKGKLQERVVSLIKATGRAIHGQAVIKRELSKHPDWQFLFTLKRNEMFVFPAADFNPSDIDLTDEKNAKVISAHLFRVQKISTKDYLFAHHLETKAISDDMQKNKKQLSGKAYRRITSPAHLAGVVKVRMDHLGRVVQKGEYQ